MNCEELSEWIFTGLKASAEISSPDKPIQLIHPQTHVIIEISGITETGPQFDCIDTGSFSEELIDMAIRKTQNKLIRM